MQHPESFMVSIKTPPYQPHEFCVIKNFLKTVGFSSEQRLRMTG